MNYFAFVCGIVWGIVLLIALIAVLAWFNIISDAESWPQQAAEMATLVAFVAIPYVFARALSELRKLGK